MTLSVSIELVSSSARVTSVKFQQGVVLTHSVRDNWIHRSDQGHLGPIKTRQRRTEHRGAINEIGWNEWISTSADNAPHCRTLSPTSITVHDTA